MGAYAFFVFASLLLGSAGAAAAASPDRTPVRSLIEFRHDDVVIQEWDLSCGAAALATLLRYQHHDPISEREIARGLINRPEYLADPTVVQARQGFSLWDMKRFADNRGYQSEAYGNLTLADLVEQAPMIVPVDFFGYRHFVVFRGLHGDRVVLADPAFGNRSLLIDRFMASWLDHPELGKIGFVVGPAKPLGPHVLTTALADIDATPYRGLPRRPLSAEAWEEEVAQFRAAAVGRPKGALAPDGDFPLLRLLAALDPGELDQPSRILLGALQSPATRQAADHAVEPPAATAVATGGLTPKVAQILIDYLRGPTPRAIERHPKRPLPPPPRPTSTIRLAQASGEPAGDLPDIAALDRALERTLTQQGGALLPFGQVEFQPSFSYTRREDDAPVFFNLGDEVFLAEDELRRDEFEAAASLRVGLPLDSQFELDLPYSYVRQARTTSINFVPAQDLDDTGSGIGDLGVGLAVALLREGSWRPDAVARLRWDSDLGEAADGGIGLGGGGNEIQGSLTLVKSQDPLAFLGAAAYQAALKDGSVDPGDELRFTLGTILAASPETSLRLFLDQSFIGETEIGGAAQPGSDQVAASLTIGAASTLGRDLLVDLALSLGLTDDAADYRAILSLPIRFGLPIR